MSALELCVLSAEAEAASASLFRTLGSHRTALAALKQPKHSRLLASQGDDAVQDRCQATLVRLLSITEAFASELLTREVEREVAGARNSVAAKIAEEAVIKGTASWSDQQKSYKDLLGVNVDWKSVEQLAEARNAVAHGLGRLTKRQMRNEQKVKDKLRAIGIAVSDNKVMLSDESLAAAANACRDFITKLDMAVQARA